VPPIHNSNNVKKCLREVPGVTGAVSEFFYATPADGSEKKQQLCGCEGWPGVGASSTTQQLQNHGWIWRGMVLTVTSTSCSRRIFNEHPGK